MNNILKYAVAVVLLGMASGCDKPKSLPCEITICKDAEAEYDSISVFCYETDYLKSRKVYLGRLNDDTTRITENCNIKDSRIGFYKLDEDSVAHYFVIEPGAIQINLYKDKIVLQGSQSNKRLIEFRQEVRNILNDKEAIYKKYAQFAADSTLTLADERNCYSQDSILSDSLQIVLQRFVSKGDAASKIAIEEFSPLFTKNTWQAITPAAE